MADIGIHFALCVFKFQLTLLSLELPNPYQEKIVEEELALYSFEMALKPTCYMESAFESYDSVAANDADYDDCENLYTIPG